MKRSRFTEEQIIGMLKEQERQAVLDVLHHPRFVDLAPARFTPTTSTTTAESAR